MHFENSHLVLELIRSFIFHIWLDAGDGYVWESCTGLELCRLHKIVTLQAQCMEITDYFIFHFRN